jgi:hypothetical protein
MLVRQALFALAAMDGNPSGQTEGWVVILKMSPHEKGTP